MKEYLKHKSVILMKQLCRMGIFRLILITRTRSYEIIKEVINVESKMFPHLV